MTDCFIDFASNDFLGFARSQILVDEVERRYMAYCQQSPHAMLGSRGSRVILGASPVLEELEKKIAEYHQVEAALVVHSGYMGNLGLCFHINQETDMIFWDEAVHVSVSQSMRLSRGNHCAFAHNDLEALETLLATHRASSCGRIFIFVCSMYSFSGNRADLARLIALSRTYDAYLIVDEAHAIGLFGDKGRGLCHQFGYENFYAVLVTYSKALGALGAAILSSQQVKKEVFTVSVPLRYSTALPPHALITINAAYDHLWHYGEQAREQVFRLKSYFQGYFSLSSCCSGQPIFLERFDSQELEAVFKRANIRVGIMNHAARPFVRVNFHAYNTLSEVEMLIATLSQYLEESGNRIDVDSKLHLVG